MGFLSLLVKNKMEEPTEPAPKKRGGRRKIKIEFIPDKSRRQITFSKRKAGLMKKAYELTTLTGTQALLLVASETGHVYTFATPKLQPFVTLPEGANEPEPEMGHDPNGGHLAYETELGPPKQESFSGSSMYEASQWNPPKSSSGLYDF